MVYNEEIKNNLVRSKRKGGFSRVSISLASPESILGMSSGEVTSPNTVRYNDSKPVQGGICCEIIFGPEYEYRCSCGKCCGIGFKGQQCGFCGVTVLSRDERRCRWGHIELVVPIANPLFFKQIPCKVSMLLGIPYTQLNKIVYYENYIVLNPGILKDKGMYEKKLLTIGEYNVIIDDLPKENRSLKDSDPDKFVAKSGAEAIYELLEELDLEKLYSDLKLKLKASSSEERSSLANRLRVVRSFLLSNRNGENRPEWMIFKILPVLPAALRPLMYIDGNVTSVDLNELYKKVVYRNKKLKDLIQTRAPEVVLRNAKRMLQEAVDNLIDNSKQVGNSKERLLKSLSESIKGKEGRFRQNLLGKRVDYSGRSVIVVNPKLKIYECGIPKGMAIELFKPIIIDKLIKRGYVTNANAGERYLNEQNAVVFSVLENLLKGYPVLLNRAPTLHRMNIQAFQPVLIEGEAIELNPLVCAQFNADFDGDQMAIHIPLSQGARLEAATLVLAGNNVLKTSDGTPCFIPCHEMILGLYYLTTEKKHHDENVVVIAFDNIDDIQLAIDNKKVDLHSRIKYRYKKIVDGIAKSEIVDTTVGRAIFNSYLPETWDFIDKTITKREIQKIIQRYSNEMSNEEVVEFLDRIKSSGFYYSYKSGISFKMSDIIVPKSKAKIVSDTINEVNTINRKYDDGYISEKGRYSQVLNSWIKASVRISKDLNDEYENSDGGFNGVYMMLVSGARGSLEQLRQIAGMKGLISKTQVGTADDENSAIIEYPITSNYKEGLDVLEYFISTYGGRKGMIDTALKTSDAGYLTRKLVDVAVDVIIQEEDCHTRREYEIGRDDCVGDGNMSSVDEFKNRIMWRISSREIRDAEKNSVIVGYNEMIDEKKAEFLSNSAIDKVYVRSVLTCECKNGLCAMCYGNRLSTNSLSQVGDAVGVIAAQSIGEPGTQLTLNTFHFGGAASNRTLESIKYARYDGIIDIKDFSYIEKNGECIVTSNLCRMSIINPITTFVLARYDVPYGSKIFVKNGDNVKMRDELFECNPYFTEILAPFHGKIRYENFGENVVLKKEKNVSTGKDEYIVFDIKDKNRAYLVINGESKEIRINVFLKSRIFFSDGDDVEIGDVIIKTPKTFIQSTDITGGLPRVSELFEVKKVENASVLSEISGTVKICGVDKNKINVAVYSNTIDYKCNYQIPVDSDLMIQDGDTVEAGFRLNAGNIDLSVLLRANGYFAVSNYLTKELQNVYAMQGVKISDKHIEIIVRQMLSYVCIVDAGDTDFISDEFISKSRFIEENRKLFMKYVITDSGDSLVYKVGQIISNKGLIVENEGLSSIGAKTMNVRPAVCAKASLVIRGISQVALSSDGFLAAASFQSTMSVLTQAAISGTVDNLTGIKANVIAGRLIQAGTGLEMVRNM